ncbi:LETM1-like protein [Actinidia rufa]|uniref:LETM1-like protein n=1 Tax=Actinidia rufa TaxID=165716 RepID=A0A7J0GL71_9ERIC|nr:LETM1-like protein [Actinidia rufa]
MAARAILQRKKYLFRSLNQADWLGQHELGSGNDGNEGRPSKQIKEASPEQCDQAVEGLSCVKAKAKSKQLHESHKGAQSIVKRLWTALLGIGPAFRAVACMSREDWAKKFRHWKDEFKSTMQHYWLGTKLLWADARISSSSIHGVLAASIPEIVSQHVAINLPRQDERTASFVMELDGPLQSIWVSF